MYYINISFYEFVVGSSINRLFKNQIKIIHVINTQSQTSDELFTYTCFRILALCDNLIELDVGNVQSKLLISKRSIYTFWFSKLTFLSVTVACFDDCLYLLDSPLDQLSSFSVKIDFINEISSAIDNLVSKLIETNEGGF